MKHHFLKSLSLVVSLLTLLPTGAAAQYPGWKHSGSIFILTTPEGANLPAAASEDNFPILVRLNKDNFDFSKAKPNGEDLRFSTSDGTPMAYQIEEWDAAAGTAMIWVRIPTIKGNARQEIKMFWGRVDALSESNGAAPGHRIAFHWARPKNIQITAIARMKTTSSMPQRDAARRCRATSPPTRMTSVSGLSASP